MADFTDDDDALLSELGVEVQARRAGSRTARQERIIAGFEDIQRFVTRHGRAPLHGEDRDIFERLYAVRLDRLRAQAECRDIVAPLDHQGLLGVPDAPTDDLDDDALLAALGASGTAAADVAELRHVRPAVERRGAEQVADRKPCEDFDRFRPLFAQVQADLDAGRRDTRPFERKSEILPGRFYILAGQKAYVATMEGPFVNEQDKTDARLRVIFDNGTESNLLMRSLQRALQKDPAGRRISDSAVGPLFADTVGDGDSASGTVYVLRSKSDHPTVAAHRDVLHKIGVTGGDVQRRLVNARLDPTFLMAEVEIVTTYELYNINRSGLEALVHRVFAPARLNITVTDRFGQPVVPQEWFLVPLHVIDEAMQLIRNGSIVDHVYNPATARLVLIAGRATTADAATGQTAREAV